MVSSPVAAPRSHGAVYQAPWGWVGSVGPTVLPVRDFGYQVGVAGLCGGAHRTLPRLRDAPPVLASAPPLVGETEVAFYVAGCWCELRGQFQV